MCGIAGIIDYRGSGPSRESLARMLGCISHRGPDAFGIYTGGNAGLAHARLSIIDLSGGDQPIYNEDRTVWTVYNGEVFNYPELREELERKGHRFYTRTDTEILVHLYEEKGPDLFEDLNGQFAVALWDSRKQELLLGRDRLGVRPIFYFHAPDRLVFGSEVKALFAVPQVPRKIDTGVLSDIFTCWAPLGDQTPFEGVYQIPPGSYGVFSRAGLSIRPYWRLDFSETQEGRSLDDWADELDALLYDAAKIRLRADVPVGAYLSGGLDSSFITSLVKKSFNNQLCTFSVSFEESRFDEASFQQNAIKAIGTDHRTIRCTNDDIGANFPKVIYHSETPMLRTAPGPLMQLSKLVRESNFKVVLTGEGSDEIFAGYDIFKEDWVRRHWAQKPGSRTRAGLLHKLYPDIFTSGNKAGGVFLENFFRRGLNRIDSPAYSHLVRWENTAQIKSFFSDRLQNGHDSVKSFVERFEAMLPAGFMNWHPLSRAQYTEITIFLSNYLLSSQGDRVAMAHAVEGRFPFLDHRVVELACRMPPQFRLCGLKDKLILRKVAAGYIPPQIAKRPKQPYRAPISLCFLGDNPPEYVTDLLSEAKLSAKGYFDPARVTSLVRKCRRQGGQLLSERENMALVGILSTQLLDELLVSDFCPAQAISLEKMKVFSDQPIDGPGVVE